MCRGPTYTAGKGSRARVQYAEARRKVKPKSKNLQGKEAALTHTNGHQGARVQYYNWAGCAVRWTCLRMGARSVRKRRMHR